MLCALLANDQKNGTISFVDLNSPLCKLQKTARPQEFCSYHYSFSTNGFLECLKMFLDIHLKKNVHWQSLFLDYNGNKVN